MDYSIDSACIVEEQVKTEVGQKDKTLRKVAPILTGMTAFSVIYGLICRYAVVAIR